MKLEVIAHTENVTHRTPILFVHGSWHGAWCWEKFLPYFARHGYGAYALSLRGHGGSEGREGIRWHSAVHGYAADLMQVIETLPAPPILVGHSMGGYVVQKYLETHEAPAGVLMSSVPPSGLIGFGIRYALRHPWQFIKAHVLLDPWYFIETPELAHEAFFSPQVPGEEVRRYFGCLQPESFRLELEALVLNLPRPAKVKTPLLVMGAANDRIFSVGEARATARAYGTEALIFPHMAHDMMLEPKWQAVADRILTWLQERGC